MQILLTDSEKEIDIPVKFSVISGEVLHEEAHAILILQKKDY